MDDYEEVDSTAEREDELNEVEYAKGFNWGYAIGEHNPSLAQELMENLVHDGGRANGMIEGFWEFFREKEKDRLNELEILREQNRNKDLNRNRY
jgi:hypothetical protein